MLYPLCTGSVYKSGDGTYVRTRCIRRFGRYAMRTLMRTPNRRDPPGLPGRSRSLPGPGGLTPGRSQAAPVWFQVGAGASAATRPGATLGRLLDAIGPTPGMHLPRVARSAAGQRRGASECHFPLGSALYPVIYKNVSYYIPYDITLNISPS